MIVYVSTTPRPTEQYFQLFVLGPNHTIADYFPEDNPKLFVGNLLRWYLGVTSTMSTVQLVSIRIKLGNQTIEPPNSTLGLESPAPSVMQLEKIIQNNETWQTPFSWSVTNATTTAAGSVRILSLQINNETYQISDWSATSGYNFRIIFELWTWQSDNNAFEFGWNSNSQHQVAWLQVWFNMTAGSNTVK